MHSSNPNPQKPTTIYSPPLITLKQFMVIIRYDSKQQGHPNHSIAPTLPIIQLPFVFIQQLGRELVGRQYYHQLLQDEQNDIGQKNKL